jgi:sortase A
VHTVTRYHDVTRIHVVTHPVVKVKSVVRYRYATKVKQVVRVRTVVKHKVTYTKKIRTITVIRYQTKTIIHRKTILRIITRYRYVQHPKTGRFAGPLPRPSGNLPPVQARLSIDRLHISWAPIWSRDFIATSDGALHYDIVPAYGVTRFSPSAPIGQPGLTVMSGHDDIYGSIFRYLGTMRRGDVVHIWQGQHAYSYRVTEVHVVTPSDVRLLNMAYTRPTLALISCTPYWVDTQRVVVMAVLVQK